MSPLLPDIRKKQTVTLSSIRKVENGTSDTILRSRLYHQRPKLRIRTRSAVHPRLCAPRPGHGTDGRLRYHVEYILKHGQENRASTSEEYHTQRKEADTPRHRHIAPELGGMHNLLSPKTLEPRGLDRGMSTHRRVEKSWLGRPGRKRSACTYK